jgi:hypothetical protein
MTAAAAVSEIVRGEALGPQLARRLAAAEARRAEIEGQVAAIALDAELGELNASTRRTRLETELAAATATVTRLRDAHRQAVERDERKRADEEIAALEKEVADYAGFVAARAVALRDLNEASRVATEAARRFLAAGSLMQTALPTGCQLPRGFIVGRNLDVTAEAVAVENAHCLQAVRSQAKTIISFKRGEEHDNDD